MLIPHTRLLRVQGEWRGPSYRLLSQNCNHFVADMFDLLCHNRFFTLAPGVSKTVRPRSPTLLMSACPALRLPTLSALLTIRLTCRMPQSLDYLYTLTIRTPKILCCCPFIPAALNA